MIRRAAVLALVVVLVLPLASAAACATPRAEVWERWLAHDPDASATIDDAPLAAFLARYLRPGEDGVNRVAYGEVSPAGRAALDAYVAALAAVPISSYDRDEQMAYWINLYNALTLQVVLDHYPVKTIREIAISPGLSSRGPWGAKLARIEGEALSLDDIEHRILRPIWQDPRIHYALNCASIGCPNLQAEPYRAATLEDQMTQAAIAYVNHPRGAALEQDGLFVSSLYVWYEADFGDGPRDIVRHLLAYAEPELALRLQHVEAIAGHRYDWALNDATR